MTVEDFADALKKKQAIEPPRPLMRTLPPADPFPVEALGPILGKAALAINDMTLAPMGLCGNAVLATAALAVQTHIDVILPTGISRPCSLFIVTIGESGERKTDVDLRASWPIAKREIELCAAEDSEKLTHEMRAASMRPNARRSLPRKDCRTREDRPSSPSSAPHHCHRSSPCSLAMNQRSRGWSSSWYPASPRSASSAAKAVNLSAATE
jgi:Protein of unknown function (DUF3987)